MDFINKLAEHFITVNRRLKRWQRVVSLLAAVVVFATTYALVLPAITLDKETASTQAGIEVAASENDSDSEGTVYDAEEEPAADPQEDEDQDAEPAAENSDSESGGQDAEVSPEADETDENTEAA